MGRKDAIKIKNLKGTEQLMIDLKPRRCDSDVYINHKMDVTELVKYIQKKKANGDELTYFHAFVTALAKVLYNRNKLNRFVANRHIWEHKDVVIAFVAKEKFTDKAEELRQIRQKTREDVQSAKRKGSKKPRFVKKVAPAAKEEAPAAPAAETSENKE